MIYVLAAGPLLVAGLYLSAVAWGASLPPWREPGDRLYLIIPGQILLLTGALCAVFAFGFSLADVYGWLSDILTHGGGL